MVKVPVDLLTAYDFMRSSIKRRMITLCNESLLYMLVRTYSNSRFNVLSGPTLHYIFNFIPFLCMCNASFQYLIGRVLLGWAKSVVGGGILLNV